MDDRELNGLLREWKAPDAPPHLRPRRPRRSWVGWLVTGSVRVPVPAALAAFLLAGFWVASARPEPLSIADAPRRSGELARYQLTGRLEGYDAVVVELNFRPGVATPQHRHPGFVLGYVVDGELRSAIDHGPDQIVPAGGTFFEPSGALHTAFGSASHDAPARVVAFMVVPTASPLTVAR